MVANRSFNRSVNFSPISRPCSNEVIGVLEQFPSQRVDVMTRNQRVDAETRSSHCEYRSGRLIIGIRSATLEDFRRELIVPAAAPADAGDVKLAAVPRHPPAGAAVNPSDLVSLQALKLAAGEVMQPAARMHEGIVVADENVD
jgi:hypothetical protein